MCVCVWVCVYAWYFEGYPGPTLCTWVFPAWMQYLVLGGSFNMFSHTPTHMQTHTAVGWFIKLLLLILNNPQTSTPHLLCCCFWLIQMLHICSHTHTHTQSFLWHAHIHTCTLTFTVQRGLGAFIFTANIVNRKKEGREAGGGKDWVCLFLSATIKVVCWKTEWYITVFRGWGSGLRVFIGGCV